MVSIRIRKRSTLSPQKEVTREKKQYIASIGIPGQRGLTRKDAAQKQFNSRIGLASESSAGQSQSPYVPFIRQSHNRQLIPSPVSGLFPPSPQGGHSRRVAARKGTLTPSERVDVFFSDPDDSESLTQLGNLSKSGLRSTDYKVKKSQRRGYFQERIDNFNVGEVLVPPKFFPSPRRKNLKITTLRPHVNLSASPLNIQNEKNSRIVEDISAEIDFNTEVKESKASDSNRMSSKYQNSPSSRITTQDHWFLMPVQGWFALSIILAAITLLLVVICVILYRSWRKQRSKIRKLSSANGILLGGCIDPVHHELCTCRGYLTYARSQLIQERASAMSRMSQHSVAVRSPSRAATLGRERNHRLAKELQSIPPANQDKAESVISIDDNFREVADTPPPPLGPKKVVGNQGSYQGKKPMAPRIPPEGISSQHAKNMRENYRRNPSDPDVQLTTIYPPPRRFEL